MEKVDSVINWMHAKMELFTHQKKGTTSRYNCSITNKSVCLTSRLAIVYPYPLPFYINACSHWITPT